MEYIDKIIESNEPDKMVELKKLLIDTILYLKETDCDKYRSIVHKLYEIVEGKKLTEKKAKEWVGSMIPLARWTMEETDKVKSEYKVDIPSIDFYALMNMLYTDYSNTIGENLDMYVKLAKDWYNDIDAKNGAEKLYCYWKYIVKD